MGVLPTLSPPQWERCRIYKTRGRKRIEYNVLSNNDRSKWQQRRRYRGGNSWGKGSPRTWPKNTQNEDRHQSLSFSVVCSPGMESVHRRQKYNCCCCSAGGARRPRVTEWRRGSSAADAGAAQSTDGARSEGIPWSYLRVPSEDGWPPGGTRARPHSPTKTWDETGVDVLAVAIRSIYELKWR
jgi:hypothetical protein